jgi:hypothetical protein
MASSPISPGPEGFHRMDDLDVVRQRGDVQALAVQTLAGDPGVSTAP